ncbi:MAG: methyltransferase domain-containing protein [Bacteroidia bacterium]|jgi:2-polyprenyl-3-methyl-5-hydroxy-6-metoxy-1,4-benzoquinol methylase|nr:methyltransferase domain-containing protein [Bacteroidia bacterium]
MNKLNSCPVCGSQNHSRFIQSKDFFLSHEIFGIEICNDCGFKFTNPRPSDSDLGRYYQSQEYISHSNTKKGLISKLYQWVRRFTLSSKEKLLLSYVSRGTLLDYGCGSGHFISYCQNKGWKVSGVEPDDRARAFAASSVRSVYKSIEDLLSQDQQKTFSAISLWHVLEHVSDLETLMGFLKQVLEKEGVLFVALPNIRSFDANKYKDHWAALDLPRHLYHFERNTLQKFMNKHGFDLIAIKPMYFDSFYVSMLSEKYRHGRLRLFAAALTGLMSNIKAINSKEYSSLIYVLKRAK